MATTSNEALKPDRKRLAAGCTILLVDDSETQAKVLEYVLTAEGYRVQVCHGGSAALAQIEAVEPDLVISDVLMPEMDGFELCRRIRGLKQANQLPVILLTHLNDPTHVLRSLEAGANYFISKPYHKDILLSRVAAALRRDQECCVAAKDGAVTCNYYGNRYAITASKPQIIDLLLATYELAVEKNEKISKTQAALRRLNEELETRVAKRTAELRNTINELRQEIADRESAEECVRRLNRLHSVLSETSKAVVHIKDRNSLFHDFCRIAVDHGCFKLAWVGLVDEAGSTLRVAAARGTTAYLNGVTIALDDESTGSGPTASAIKNGSFYICNDFLNAPITAPWHDRGRDYGIHASASIALQQEGRVIGALTLYADKKNYFDRPQVELLRQMGADISFALGNMVREDRRLEVEHALLEETARRLKEREQHAQKIEYLAHYDPVTKLPNRFSLMARLAHSLELAKRCGSRLALIFIDLDRFKNINDSLGHHVGDQLLFQVAGRLLESIRTADIVARLGGDEFVVGLPLLRSNISAAHALSKIQHALSQSYYVEGHELSVTPSIGISIFPDDGETVQDLMKNADLAMYHAKAGGRNNYQFFTQEMNETVQERLALEGDLRVAIERGEFLLHYQPQIEMCSGKVVGVEALLRWQHPVHGLVTPDKFIPVAEETGMIVAIGEVALKSACRQLASWRAAGLPPLRVSVNLSARQFKQNNLPALLLDILRETGIESHLLELEITESSAMDNPAEAILHLRGFREMGVELAIDDFGTGYSSLSYLKLFPVHRLKIDRSFVKDIDTDTDDAEIAAATIALAHTLGKEVVAEGVETEAQCRFLQGQCCDIVQGYYFSRPLPPEEIVPYLKRSPAPSLLPRT
ncbi:GGDEF/EAL domain-containing response regulator [Geomonas subterranea]|uniref:EAL domain-containing protein n=1 Tax=Geomonas subterranea TaxID=2847989 RepID=A0ABX8LJG9_9BACT|nr:MULTISPECIES: EAL domain-containing protein [Geomonas]QXE91624.1 EAL domain-containing protein [Geomonas subterranea]QXM10284.1 EAL domain-containing protein [Geomonas subterranea]